MSDDDQKNLLERAYWRLRNRIIWSWAGWCDAWRNEHSFRSWVYANVISAALAIWLPIGPGERAVILTLGVLLLAAELFNTAIERLTDLVTKEHHELAGQAKDAGSAAVAVTAIAAGIAWGTALIRLAMG